MSTLKYPSAKEYRLPKKNVLVLSCIDLRLTDNLLEFLHHDNLANRYDHVILAGTSLCAFANDINKKLFDKTVLTTYDHFQSWKRMFDEHLQIARELHDIRDVYIVEHTNCGAYKEFLIDGDFKTNEEERKSHKHFSMPLANEINGPTYDEYKKGKKVGTYKIHVHCFLIDLRGNVSLLHTTNKPK